MEINSQVMDPLEKTGFLLRGLYQDHGFTRYHMSKFEEYDLYSRNRDFLLSEGVITFTDTNGKLMALKPDVTLSIVKNTQDSPGRLQKLYYHENVYRVSESADGFREETQVGLECMGPVEEKTISEILSLAAESLSLLSGRYLLEIGQLDLLKGMAERLGADAEITARILRLAGEKNLHGIHELCGEYRLPPTEEQRLRRLLSAYGTPGETLPVLAEVAAGTGLEESVREMEQALAPLRGTEAESHLWIDCSVSANLKYYHGFAIKGYLEGIPDPVLSGGQYDALMRRMHRKDRAIGFAVFLNRLERL